MTLLMSTVIVTSVGRGWGTFNAYFIWLGSGNEQMTRWQNLLDFCLNEHAELQKGFAAILRLWARLLFTLILLDNDMRMRQCHTVSQSWRRVKRVSVPHLEGNYHQVCTREHAPGSLLLLGRLPMSDTGTWPCVAEEVPTATVSVFHSSVSREQIRFQCR